MWTLSCLHVLAVSFGLCWWSCTEPSQPCKPAGTWWRWEEGGYPSFGAPFPGAEMASWNQKWERPGHASVFRVIKSDYSWERSQNNVKSQRLIYPLWDLLSKTKPEILRHAMKCPEENTLLPDYLEVIQNGFCSWPNTGQFLPFHLRGDCNRSSGWNNFWINPLTAAEFQQEWFHI